MGHFSFALKELETRDTLEPTTSEARKVAHIYSVAFSSVT